MAAGAVLVGLMFVTGGERQPEETAAPAYSESIENYGARELRGFTLMVNHEMVEGADLLERVMLQLEHDLDQMERVVPAPAFEVLRESTVWIERQGAVVPGGMSGRGMCFHPSKEWLTGHGLLAEKQGGVEIINAADYPVWRVNQPWMTFHEFAHAYHWRLGFQDAEIKAAYDAAMGAGLYDAVDYNMASDGKPVKAYAANNEREYFAELSEAYFGLNDFFPFTRRQLKELDPAGYELVEKLWSLSEEELNHGGH